jgi:DNA polymerase-3 subunit beta
MKVECSKENLVNTIGVAEKTTGKNLTLPVLGCLLLEATEDNFLKIRATNIDLGIEISVKAKVDEPGRVVVPGNILLSVISSMYDSNNITLTIDDVNLIVSTPRSKTVIKSLPTEDFPTLPETGDDDSTFSINTFEFLKGMQTVWYSASTTTIKQELSSVYIYTYDKKIYFVATDSFRLAEKILTTKKNTDFEPILVPIKNVVEIIKVFEYLGDVDVDVSLNSNQIVFKTDEVYLTSRLIDGSFPDYKQILPKEFSTDIIVLKQDLINILKKINIFSDKSNQVQFDLSPSKKKVILKAQNKDVGETVENLETAVTGDDLKINFNHKYISDCLHSINSDSVSLSFTGLSKPMVIKGVSDPSFLYLVMPMNK